MFLYKFGKLKTSFKSPKIKESEKIYNKMDKNIYDIV